MLNKSIFFSIRIGMVCLIFSIIGCVSGPRIYGGKMKEAGGHQVTEIMVVASREQILYYKPTYNALISSGISDRDIKNGTVAVGRIYCCGGEGTVETQTTAVVYVPPKLNVKAGDIVEFVSGAGSSASKLDKLNRVVQIRHEYGMQMNLCRWEPENPKLWMRVIYCPWMKDEGWLKGGGLSPVWYKPRDKMQ